MDVGPQAEPQDEEALFAPFGGRAAYEREVARCLAVSVVAEGLAAQRSPPGAAFRLVHPRQYGAMLRRRAAVDKVRAHFPPLTALTPRAQSGRPRASQRTPIKSLQRMAQARPRVGGRFGRAPRETEEAEEAPAASPEPPPAVLPGTQQLFASAFLESTPL